MQLKASITLVAALAALSEASPFRLVRRGNDQVSVVTVHPIPLSTGASSSPSIAPSRTSTESADGVPTGLPTDKIPMSTGPSGPAPTGPAEMTTLVVTYTLGRGSSASVVTRVVTRPADAPAPSQAPAQPQVPNGPKPEDTTSLTTTIQSTSTYTKTITLMPSPSDVGGAPGSGAPGIGNNKNIGGNGAAQECVPSTVTVEKIKTLYVTVMPSAPATPQQPQPGKPENPDNSDGEEQPEPAVPSVTAVPSAPYQNGTVTSTTRPHIGSSGFLTRPAPTHK